MLDAHQLNIFLVASETLNFSQAAKRLNMSQPSVSQHIHSLETRFDRELFSRSGRSVRLTDAGKELIPLARDLVKQSILIEETMESLHGEVYGHLRVGCSTTPGKYVLPRLLTRFHHLYPQVTVTCLVCSQCDAINLLNEGDIHFVLADYERKSTKNADFREFLRETVVLIAPLSHPWAKKDKITSKDLLEGHFILREESSGTFAAVREALESTEVPIGRLKTFLTLGSAEGIALSVQEGLGVGFVSSTVATGLSHGRVAIVDIEDLEISRDICIGRHTRMPSTRAQTAFWGFITKVDVSPK